jgi:hypothetical protein
MPYSELKADFIIETIAMLKKRISERFRGSSLSAVSDDLYELAIQADTVTKGLRRPIWPLRVAAILAGLVVLAGVVAVVRMCLSLSPRAENTPELLQGVDAALNQVIFLFIAIYFLVNVEERVKRRKAIRALHKLRSIVHIVDMHQLTKDPEFVLSPGGLTTPASPKRTMTRFELARYLDYCSELLSLTSKVAALHAQELHDPVVLSAVSDIESLAGMLSNKIWQKIMILDTIGQAADNPVTG